MFSPIEHHFEYENAYDIVKFNTSIAKIIYIMQMADVFL
jgi:hypothetical protein